MLKFSLKALWAHKRRLAGTSLAVLLGVALLTGTLVLSDTLRRSIDQFFVTADQGTDVVVRNATNVSDSAGGPRDLIDQGLTDQIRQLPGVAVAEPAVVGFGELIGHDGKAVSGQGPRQAGSWVPDPQLNPYRLVEGRAPQADDEVVINRGAAKDGGLHAGDTTDLLTPDRVRVRIVGIATFGTADAFGGTSFTAFTLHGAQLHVTKRPNQVSTISVRATPGTRQEDLLGRVRGVLPPGTEAITGTQLTQENMAAVNSAFLEVFRNFLVVFAAVALLVAAFSIYNTLSILVAQRTRESALLRALGAERGQVLGAVVVEALLIGVVAGVAGIGAGLGIAAALKGIFVGFGMPMASTSLVLTGTTVAVSLTAGVAVPLLAGVIPALRASRVAPLAALRDSLAEPGVGQRGAVGLRRRAVAGLALSGAGVAVILSAVAASSTATGGGVTMRAGLGALLCLAGVVVLGPVVARPVSRLLGAPLPRLRGVTGALARQNAMRNPRRTAGTAAALMVGVGVVTLFTVFAASLKASTADNVAGSFHGDLVVSPGGFGGNEMSPRLAADAAKLPEVRSATGMGGGTALIGGASQQAGAADPAALGDVLQLRVTQGGLRELGGKGLAISQKAADDQGWRLGSTVPVTFSDGATGDFTVAAVYQARDVVGDYLMARSAWAPHAAQNLDRDVFVVLRDGVDLAAGKAAVERVAARYGAPPVMDRGEYIDSLTGYVNAMLGVVYAMLALAIVIALMGIANTLSLSIHERTRELGLLRAVGQTRGQLRAMVRWESVIVALFGTVGGIGLGGFLGWGLVRATAGQSDLTVFSAPLGKVLIVVVVGALAGVLAGLRPARRAARLNPLQAIASE